MKQIYLILAILIVMFAIGASYSMADEKSEKTFIILISKCCQASYGTGFIEGNESRWQEGIKGAMMMTGYNAEQKQSFYDMVVNDKDMSAYLKSCAKYGAKDKFCGQPGGCRKRSMAIAVEGKKLLK